MKYKTLQEAVTSGSSAPDYCRTRPYYISIWSCSTLRSGDLQINFGKDGSTKGIPVDQFKITSLKSNKYERLFFLTKDDAEAFASAYLPSDCRYNVIMQRFDERENTYIRVDDGQIPFYISAERILGLINGWLTTAKWAEGYNISKYHPNDMAEFVKHFYPALSRTALERICRIASPASYEHPTNIGQETSKAFSNYLVDYNNKSARIIKGIQDHIMPNISNFISILQLFLGQNIENLLRVDTAENLYKSLLRFSKYGYIQIDPLNSGQPQIYIPISSAVEQQLFPDLLNIMTEDIASTRADLIISENGVSLKIGAFKERYDKLDTLEYNSFQDVCLGQKNTSRSSNSQLRVSDKFFLSLYQKMAMDLYEPKFLPKFIEYAKIAENYLGTSLNLSKNQFIPQSLREAPKCWFSTASNINTNMNQVLNIFGFDATKVDDARGSSMLKLGFRVYITVEDILSKSTSEISDIFSKLLNVVVVNWLNDYASCSKEIIEELFSDKNSGTDQLYLEDIIP